MVQSLQRMTLQRIPLSVREEVSLQLQCLELCCLEEASIIKRIHLSIVNVYHSSGLRAVRRNLFACRFASGELGCDIRKTAILDIR